MGPEALAALAALTWGSSGLLGGFVTRSAPVVLVALGAQTAGLLPALLAATVAGPGPTLRTALAGSIGGAVSGAGLICLYRALSGPAVGLAAPVAATGSLVPVLVGLGRGDSLDVAQGIGAAVLVAGLGATLHTRGGRPFDGRTFALSAAAAACFGIFFLGLDLGARDSPGWVTVWARLGAITALGTVALRLGTLRGLAIDRRLWLVAVVGVTDSAGNLAYAAATSSGHLSTVSLISGSYPVITVLLAVAVLGERITVLRAGGVLASAVGLGLIASQAA